MPQSGVSFAASEGSFRTFSTDCFRSAINSSIIRSCSGATMACSAAAAGRLASFTLHLIPTADIYLFELIYRQKRSSRGRSGFVRDGANPVLQSGRCLHHLLGQVSSRSCRAPSSPPRPRRSPCRAGPSSAGEIKIPRPVFVNKNWCLGIACSGIKSTDAPLAL